LVDYKAFFGLPRVGSPLRVEAGMIFSIMAWTYILMSNKVPKTYVGSTTNIEKRILEHNAGKSLFTKRYIPWKLIHSEKFDTLTEARLREKYLKTAAGRKFIKQLFIPR
jgi:putative endonuclease